MLCKIADLLTEVPAAGGMASRCRDYQSGTDGTPDIVIREEAYRPGAWPEADEALLAYMESGLQFYWGLLCHSGMMLHASAAALEGRAYLFSGPCGVGKSTHTGLWRQTFGGDVQIFNDDKPALRRLDGRWYAYGTPWCGKDGMNQNKKVPVAGICFLRRGEKNVIRRLTPAETVRCVLNQTLYRLWPEQMDLLLGHIDALAREIPAFELSSRPETAAARLSYETMRRAAEEMGL